MTSGREVVASIFTDGLDFVVDIFRGVGDGDIVSIIVVGILALVLLRLIAARWVFVLAKQVLIFGGLAFGVWYASGAVGDKWGESAGHALLYVGEGIVALLFLIMLYMFFLRKAREKEAALRVGTKKKGVPLETIGPGGEKVTVTPGGTGMRVGAGALQGQGLKVHYEKVPGSAKATPAGAAGGGGATAAPGEEHHTRIEDVLRKMNVLGANKDQNLLTVMVLILVAEFGVFTSRTISAPNPEVGMFLFFAFIAGAVVFVKTSYKNYWTGVRHFVFATVFAMALSVVLLKYWQGVYCPGQGASSDCAEDLQVALTWGKILTPDFYFQSDGLIAAITGVAFSTLLTKGGG